MKKTILLKYLKIDLYTDLKIILDHQNNYVERLSVDDLMLEKNFNILMASAYRTRQRLSC